MIILLIFAISINNSRKSKITNLNNYLRPSINKNIGWLEVTMNHEALVEVADSFECLQNDLRHDPLTESRQRRGIEAVVRGRREQPALDPLPQGLALDVGDRDHLLGRGERRLELLRRAGRHGALPYSGRVPPASWPFVDDAVAAATSVFAR